MGDKAVAWPVCRCWVPDTTATWLGVPFLQFIAHTNPSSRQLQGTLACAMICRKATFTISFSEVMLPDANFLSSRAQNRVFCALFGSGTPVFGLFEHKIGVFVLFWGLEPSFSGVSSTKSRFLCAFAGGWSPTCGRRLRKEGIHTGHDARIEDTMPELKARGQNCGHDAIDAGTMPEMRRGGEK